MKSKELKQFRCIKAQGYLSCLVGIFGSFRYRGSIYMGVCVLNAIFAFMNGFLIQTPSVFLRIFMFPDSSAGKESACNAGDPSLIPVLGRYPGEGIGYPLQNSQTSLVTQTVKTLPAMQDIWVQKNHLEEGMATHSSILAWNIPMGRGAWWVTVHRVPKSRR